MEDLRMESQIFCQGCGVKGGWEDCGCDWKRRNMTAARSHHVADGAKHVVGIIGVLLILSVVFVSLKWVGVSGDTIETILAIAGLIAAAVGGFAAVMWAWDKS